jgi:hypothetical protein
MEENFFRPQYGVGYHPWCTCRLFNSKPGATVTQRFQLSVFVYHTRFTAGCIYITILSYDRKINRYEINLTEQKNEGKIK